MLTDIEKKKFEEIVRKLDASDRSELMKLITGTPVVDRENVVRLVISKYESGNLKFTPQPSRPSSYQTIKKYEEQHAESAKAEAAPAVTPAHVSKTAGQKPKRKLKKQVKKNFITAIAVMLICLVGLVAFVNKDKIFKGLNMATAETEISVTPETSATETVPTATPTPTPTPTVTPTPAPTPVPVAEDHPDLTGLKVVIDPGHQETTDEEEELYASWLSTTKPRCTSGTTGVVTGIHEYELTLDYAIIIKEYLEQCGAEVILTREENDVDISNQERAQIAVDNGADVFIRLHADAASDSKTSGVRVYVPDTGSFTGSSSSNGNTLGELVSEALGLEFDSSISTHLYTGLNYANSVNSYQISLGFLSNSDDEAILTDAESPVKVAEAISVFCEAFV